MFKQWLLDNDCRDVCMESTGKYWIPVFNLLEDEINVTIANPKFSEIGIDMTQFCNSKRLCCWAGLTPGSNESAGKKKSVRITRAGVYLKPALVQCAHAAVQSDKSPYYKKKGYFLLMNH